MSCFLRLVGGGGDASREGVFELWAEGKGGGERHKWYCELIPAILLLIFSVPKMRCLAGGM
jgi:hypothetical protein